MRKRRKKRTDCEQCGAPLPTRQGKGQPQRFCSRACKQQAHRQQQDPKANTCKHCGQQLAGAGLYCSDRCHYYDNKGELPRNKMHLTAWDEELIPFVPLGQQKFHEVNRPAWHAFVYGGRRR